MALMRGNFLLDFFLILGIGSDSGEKSSRVQVGTSDSQRVDGKNQQDIHWHSRYTRTKNLFCCVLSNVWLKGVNILCYTLCGILACIVNFLYVNQFNCPLTIKWAVKVVHPLTKILLI